MIDEACEIPDLAARRELLGVLARAFRDNPMNREIHGANPNRRVRANRAGLRALVLDGDRETMTRVIRHEGRVVGGFVAAPPGLHPLPSPSFWRQLGCFFQQGAREMDRWGQVSHTLIGLRPPDDHWYLAVLGVDPEWQGRGFGGRLLAGFFELSSDGSTPFYLESDRPESVRFYRARGFLARAETSVHGVRCWCLGRGFADENSDLCDSVRQAESAPPIPPAENGAERPLNWTYRDEHDSFVAHTGALRAGCEHRVDRVPGPRGPPVGRCA